MANTKFSSSLLYFILWITYSLQGVLYQSGGVVSRGLLLILLIWSLCIMWRVNTSSPKLPLFFKSLNVFIFVTTIYGVILILSGQDLYVTEGHMNVKVSNIDYLKNIYMSLLPMYVFYDYTRRGKLTLQQIMFFTLGLLIVAVINFYDRRTELLLEVSRIAHNSDGVTLNIGYDFLALMPLLLLWNKKTATQYILLLTTLFFVILCMKRGAIIIGVICFIYFLNSTFKYSRGNKRALVFALSTLAVLGTILIFINMLDSNDYFAYRIEQTLQGNSSNRDQLYSTFWNHFISETNIIRFLFGNGANATLKVGMNFAHNDWLELAINNGLLGLCIYIWYYLSLVKDSIKALKVDKLYYSMIIMALMIMLFSSMFSMSYANINLAVSLAVGYALAKIYNTSTLPLS